VSYNDVVKRGAFKLLVLLLAGAIINVAVAWGGQFLNRLAPKNYEIMAREECSREWRTFALSSWPQAVQPFGIQYKDAVWKFQQIDDSEDSSSARGFLRAQAGWPYRSVQAIAHRDNKRFIHGLGWLTISDDILFPYAAMLPGFAINTIFYAAIVWFLFFAPGAIRRRVRRKRGQCAACGYSLRGTPDVERCPECGAAPSDR
jgi:hypothetical protein